ncbi:LOW QUALITY PROTEIN: RAD50-interacting protein 1-like [Portunus trituberculatus]|uniref:LOW QUALITY PROTEIN: RAD50-interacting protein 1-like n=1 Tax=Portunus trituberculatus TaxID=210409 RepID=UPI001E1D1363|nr:LOW QUALITY PROTEIN: RAD50-interacting protein 1-like [Portunus trituberculatus]
MRADFNSLVDADEVTFKVTSDLNDLLGGEARHLGRVVALVEKLITQRQHLQQRLQFATTEAPDKITRAINSAERALGEGERLLGECQAVQEKVDSHSNKYGGLLGEVGPGVRVVGELGRVERYQLFLDMVEEWSQDISAALRIGAEGQALVGHSKLVASARNIVSSECLHLQQFLLSTLLHWNKALVQRFTGEFEAILKSLKWPLVGGTGGTGGGQLPASPDTLQRLCTLTQYLLQLALPGSPPQPLPPLLVTFDPLLLPIQLLVNPLQVRFLYHFSGNRSTNNKNNPEWYFIQLLKWIVDHESFLVHRIQPVLDRCGRGEVLAKVEFMRGLVRLAAIKVTSDLAQLQDDDDLFCATIQEVLHFHRELCDVHGYPHTQPAILSVLTEPRVFPRWLALERKFALELMDELVSSEGAWEEEEEGGGGGGGGGGAGGGGGGGARCGEKVILLLQGITDRYKQLPQPGHRIQFLELQLDLLDDFRVRLLQVMKGERQDPLTSHYPAILNTTHHLSSTLSDWADLPFYIEMQYYQEAFRKAIAGTTTTTTTTTTTATTPAKDTPKDDYPSLISPPPPPPPSSSIPPTPEHLKYEATPPSRSQLAEVTGSVFDLTISLYKHIEVEMVKTLSQFVFSEVRARSLPYRRDGWHKAGRVDGRGKVKVSESVGEGVCESEGECVRVSESEVEMVKTLSQFVFSEVRARSLPYRRDGWHKAGRVDGRGKVKVVELSPSVCPLVEVVARHLHTLRDALHPPLFHSLWGQVAYTLDKYIYEELVLETRFSEAGALQFKFDMANALFPIFGAFTQRPENYFRLVKESTILLTLPRATVLLLQDTLGASDSPIPPQRALGELGVSLLSPTDAAAVLNARIYE